MHNRGAERGRGHGIAQAVDLTAQPAGPGADLAKRSADLQGTRLGLLDDAKANSGVLLEEVRKLVEQELPNHSGSPPTCPDARRWQRHRRVV